LLEVNHALRAGLFFPCDKENAKSFGVEKVFFIFMVEIFNPFCMPCSQEKFSKISRQNRKIILNIFTRDVLFPPVFPHCYVCGFVE
jgi:hypothetical protein